MLARVGSGSFSRSKPVTIASSIRARRCHHPHDRQHLAPLILGHSVNQPGGFVRLFGVVDGRLGSISVRRRRIVGFQLEKAD